MPPPLRLPILPSRRRPLPRFATHFALGYALRETLQALVFFSGQVLINNCDIVLVKHFFRHRGRTLCGRSHGGPRDLCLFLRGGE